TDDILSFTSRITSPAGLGVRRKYLKKKGKGSVISTQEANPVRLNYKPLYNEKGSYGSFLLPGLLALILQQTLLIGLAASMAVERQNKKIPELLQWGKNSFSAILWGKGLYYFLLFACYALFFFTFIFYILHILHITVPLQL